MLESIELVASLLYYAYLFVGSISIGYIFLRVTHPEIRTLTKTKKLRKAMLITVVFVAVTIGLDVFFSSAELVLSANGLTPLIASSLIALSFGAFSLFSRFKTKPFLVVGVPEPKKKGAAKLLPMVKEVRLTPEPVPAPAPQAAPAAPAPAKEPSVKERLSALRKRGAIPSQEKKEGMHVKGGPEKKQKGFFARLFSKRAEAKPEAKLGAKAEKKEKPVSKYVQKKKEAEARKVRETEVQLILKDLAEEGKIFEEPEGEEGEEGEEGLPRHRLYLKKRLEAKQKKEKRGGSPRAKEKEELKGLMQDLYGQLEAGPETAAKEVKEVKVKAKPAKRGVKHVEEKEKPLSMSDLFGGGEEAPSALAGTEAGEKPSGVFAQLEEISGGGEGGGEAEEAKPEKKEKPHGMHFLKMQAKKGMGCPTCHSKNSRIIFCPYCGVGMCANCTPSLKPLPDAFEYVCPKCNERVTVKKKSAEPVAAVA